MPPETHTHIPMSSVNQDSAKTVPIPFHPLAYSDVDVPGMELDMEV